MQKTKLVEASLIIAVVALTVSLPFSLASSGPAWQVGSNWQIASDFKYDQQPTVNPSSIPNGGGGGSYSTTTATPSASPSAQPSTTTISIQQLNPLSNSNNLYFIVGIVLAIIVLGMVLSSKQESGKREIKWPRY